MPLKQMKPALEGEGVTYLYVRSFPREAERLSFNLAAVAAVRGDGVEIPLSLRFAEFRGSELNRQRLVASNPLPPGIYKGFSFKVKNAFLKGEEGEAALLVPDEAARLDFPFEVKEAKALLISLSFRHDESLRGVRFSPVFAAAIPGRPLPGLTGYVTNQGADTITVFDKKTAEAVDAIQTGRGPAGIVLDQRQRRAYAALTGEDAVEVIDVAAGAVVNRIRLTPGDAPRDLALTPDGNTLITANSGSNSVSMIDPSSLLEFARINLASRPRSVVIDRAGRRAYVFNVLANNITVLDIPNRQVLPASIPTDSSPLRGEFNRKGDRFIVYQEWSPYLLLIDPVSLSEVKRINAGMGINWLKTDTGTDKLYVGKKDDPTVDIYDPFSLIPGDFLAAAGAVSHMTIDGEENNLYLIIPEKKVLQLINLVSRKVVGEIDLDDNPYWATVVGER